MKIQAKGAKINEYSELQVHAVNNLVTVYALAVLDTTLQSLGKVTPHIQGCTVIENNAHMPTGESCESAIARNTALL